ncbi:alpha/beta hydrolase [Microcoleus sp. FACHB-1515]|uniref:alpha/beta fold hydrolase n=1 Tax=Cyanophyceae TaxID=3028117 RepID=UPI0016841CFE|nr:alpha/beta hydrolase [Microcoleus sp. FACHB-1515]MBD2092910.1 alpha/beta hydrolase [Microcoleus sp. FACHB-1515]
MAYVSIRGVDHYYEWVTADGGQPSGKPVMVFMHGWGGSDRYWESTAQALKQQFDCLLYDLRGFGRSPLPKPIPEEVKAIGYELETYAEDLALLLDALGIQKIVLNAHSTGSSIAVFFLNLYPERVDRAILTCSGIFEYDEKAFKAFYKFGGYVVAFRPKWLSRIPFVDRIFMARFLHRSIPQRDRQAFLEDFLVADYDAAMGTIYTAVSERAVEVMPKEFAQLQVPTLLISGQYDQIIPAEMGRQAAALNSIVEHIVMPKTSHFPMLEDPDTYLQHVRRFLAIEPATI